MECMWRQGNLSTMIITTACTLCRRCFSIRRSKSLSVRISISHEDDSCASIFLDMTAPAGLYLKRSRVSDKFAAKECANVCNRRQRHLPSLVSQAALSHFTLRLTVLHAVYCGAQQMAEPSSFACFASYAVAFYIATKVAKKAQNLYRNFQWFYRAEILQLSCEKCAEPIQKLRGFSRTAIFQLSRVKCEGAGDLWHLLYFVALSLYYTRRLSEN